MTRERLHARCGGGCAAGHHHEAGAGGRPFAFAHSPRHFERPRPFAIEHIALDLGLDFETKSVAGSAALRLTRIDPEADGLELDAIGFTISAVTVDGKAARYVYDGRLLFVSVPRAAQQATLMVEYAATPRKGLYFLEPDEHVPGRPKQAWTQFQEEDARHVFPCHDKPHVKMTTEVRVRVPKGFFVLSNGDLVARDVKGESAVFHWKMNDPHPSYLVTIVAGELAQVEDRIDIPGRPPVPLTYLVPKGREGDVERTFGRTPAMVKLFSELTGIPYPWTKYAQVVVSDFVFGGMENTTATTMYEHILLDERAALDVSSDDLVAHELAHQWFGDYVTCRDWSEGWLNEGFATYFEHVWRENALGIDEYYYGLEGDLGSYLGEASGRYRRPVVCQEYDAPLDLFDRHLYEKGGLTLHALRTELGSSLFWKGVNLYLTRHGRGIVETRDLWRALEEVSGRSLGRRIEELVYKPGHPEVEVALSWSEGVLTCAAKQTQSHEHGVPSVFEVPLILDIATGEGAVTVRREKLTLKARVDTFAVPCPERPSYVVVDPELRVIGSLSVKAPGDMARRQLAGAASARARRLAAETLAGSDDPPSIAALVAKLRDEDEFWGTRVACAEALGKIRARECEAALIDALAIAHPKVRRAVVAALGQFRSARAFEALTPKALRDPSYLVEAEAARALGRTRQPAAYEVLLDVIDRPSWADVISGAALEGLGLLRDDRGLPHILARTRYGHPSRVRRAATMAIPKLATDRRAREQIEDLLDDRDPILRMDVVRALADLGDARSRGALRARVDVELDPRVRRRIREVVRDLGTEKKIGDQIKEELEKLSAEHADLKARLSKLEARSGAASSKKTTKGATPPKRRVVAKATRRK